MRLAAAMLAILMPAALEGQPPGRGVQAVYERGVWLEREGRIEEAVAAYTEVLRLDAKSAGALRRRAALLMRLGRLEEAEERYELVLAIGFLQWRDPTGTAVARHVLTAPAELTLDAARGLLSVAPAASFDAFRVELDMLELQHHGVGESIATVRSAERQPPHDPNVGYSSMLVMSQPLPSSFRVTAP